MGARSKRPYLTSSQLVAFDFLTFTLRPIARLSSDDANRGINHLAGVPTIPEMVPAAHRATNEHLGTLSERVVTIASLLEASGYHTYLSGKWHLGSDPHQRPIQGVRTDPCADGVWRRQLGTQDYIPIYDDATWTENGEPIRRPSGVYSRPTSSTG